MIINFKNIADDNALFGKVKKKIINFRRSLKFPVL